METNKGKHFNLKSILVLFQNLFCFTAKTETHRNDSKTDFKLKCFPLIISVSLQVSFATTHVSVYQHPFFH